jgi:hypothetical protein
MPRNKLANQAAWRLPKAGLDRAVRVGQDFRTSDWRHQYPYRVKNVPIGHSSTARDRLTTIGCNAQSGVPGALSLCASHNSLNTPVRSIIITICCLRPSDGVYAPEKCSGV